MPAITAYPTHSLATNLVSNTRIEPCLQSDRENQSRAAVCEVEVSVELQTLPLTGQYSGARGWRGGDGAVVRGLGGAARSQQSVFKTMSNSV